MIFIFDLDDTLYPEINYVLSGFKTLSKYLEINHNIDSERSYKFMKSEVEKNGRGKVFDKLLKQYNIFTKGLLRKCILIYRHHDPNIFLDLATKEILNYLKGDIYLVTDGHKVVQAKKIKALNLDLYFKKIFITHRYGTIHSKPSTYCFDLIRKSENCDWNELVYIGDNPQKDFVNLNSNGSITIRVLSGMFSSVKALPGYGSKYEIRSLKNLLPLLRDNNYL